MPQTYETLLWTHTKRVGAGLVRRTFRKSNFQHLWNFYTSCCFMNIRKNNRKSRKRLGSWGMRPWLVGEWVGGDVEWENGGERMGCKEGGVGWGVSGGVCWRSKKSHQMGT